MKIAVIVLLVCLVAMATAKSCSEELSDSCYAHYLKVDNKCLNGGDSCCRDVAQQKLSECYAYGDNTCGLGSSC